MRDWEDRLGDKLRAIPHTVRVDQDGRWTVIMPGGFPGIVFEPDPPPPSEPAEPATPSQFPPEPAPADPYREASARTPFLTAD